MHPEVFQVPFTALTVKSYGLMLVIGFLAAMWLIRRLSRDFTPHPDMVTSAAIYALVAGLVGSRIFYVLHHLQEFRTQWYMVFAVWHGGLELLGGGLPAMLVILLYIKHYKLPARKYMDIVVIGLLVALSFGRIGCFLNGCCFGRPANLPWAVKFPYNSPVYNSQVRPDPARGREMPYINLPDSYWYEYQGIRYLKEPRDLSAGQLQAATTGPYRCLAVHPTELYESAGAAILAGLLFLYWQWGEKVAVAVDRKWYYPRQGYVFGVMFVLYGAMRFVNESLRDDNPFEFDGMTISQNLAIAMILFGVVTLFVCSRMKQAQFVTYPAKAKPRK
jgi:phosphatidylglycerol---prolipoprotein diacylglyceryl transferase